MHVAIEILGVIGKRSLAFIKARDHRVRQSTGGVEGENKPSSASLCSCTEGKYSFCVGVSRQGGTVRSGLVWYVIVYIYY